MSTSTIPRQRSAPSAPAIDWATEAPATDLDRARLLLRYVEQSGRRLATVAEDQRHHGDWLVWSGSTWDRRSADAVRPLAHEVSDHFARASRRAAAERRAAAADLPSTPHLRRSALPAIDPRATASAAFATASIVDKALRELRSLVPAVAQVDLDPVPDVLGCRNGVVDLRTGVLRDYRPEDMISRRVDVDFDSSATAPRWSTFLDEVFLAENGTTDRDVIAFMQRLTGYTATGHTRDHVLPTLIGSAGAGKSTFVKTLEHVLGKHVASAAFETFEARSNETTAQTFAEIRGARMVLASEGESGAAMRESVLKRATGGDMLPARELFCRPFSYKPSFCLWMVSNDPPSFSGTDEGIWARVLHISFRAYYERGGNAEARLPEQLRSEAAGVLAWIVAGAVAWYRDGLQVPATVRADTAAVRADVDPLGEFLAAHYVRSDVQSDCVKMTDVYPLYLRWCAAQGVDPLGPRNLNAALRKRRGFGVWKRHKVAWLSHVRPV